MRIFVAGATGAIGRRLVPELVARGHQVIATTRNPGKARLLESLSAEPVVVDGLDRNGVAQAVARAQPDAIVHQMTALAEKADPQQFDVADLRHFDRWFAATNRLRTEGTQHLLAAAHANGVRRFVAQSYTGWTNVRSGGPVKTEEDPFDPRPVKAQRASMFAIRFLEEAVLGAPLDGVVLRYGNFYGPGASGCPGGSGSPTQDAHRWRRRWRLVLDPPGRRGDRHRDCRGAGAARRLQRDRRRTSACVGVAALLWWRWSERSGPSTFRSGPPDCWPERCPTRWMTESRGSSNAKLRAASDWRPRWSSWRDGFRFALTAAPFERDQGRASQVGGSPARQQAT